jgi:hypothetical protein
MKENINDLSGQLNGGEKLMKIPALAENVMASQC